MKVPVGGQDSELAGLQRILAGEQSFSIYKQIKPQADTTAGIAVKLLKGDKFDDLVNTKVDSLSGEFKGIPSRLYDATVVTKENIGSTIVADKVYKASEICTPEYKKACDAAGDQVAPAGKPSGRPLPVRPPPRQRPAKRGRGRTLPTGSGRRTAAAPGPRATRRRRWSDGPNRYPLCNAAPSPPVRRRRR